MKDILIAPSILSCDFLRLGAEIEDVEEAGADLIHIDVMDGNFVPNITIGPMFVEALRRINKKPLDVHLMIANPAQYVQEFARAGSDIITIHAETDNHLFRTLDVIKESGARAGISFNPATPLNLLEHVIHIVDLVLIMTVNPGFGGQKYIPAMAPKITEAHRMIEKAGHYIDLEVDGGIKAVNAAEVVKAGGNVLVMGTEIFHSGDYRKKIEEVRSKIGQ
ncbi:MAG TPA: ribulose-phosphate 3-epimerase [Deltaproteobacteria bacterium]|nr:ribulose-phosphate 3-epimerase [Deltaproteobacteria bacterium]